MADATAPAMALATMPSKPAGANVNAAVRATGAPKLLHETKRQEAAPAHAPESRALAASCLPLTRSNSAVLPMAAVPKRKPN